MLDEFRHQHATGEQVGQRDKFGLYQSLGQPIAEGLELVTHHHRLFHQHGFKRRRTGSEHHHVGGDHRLAALPFQQHHLEIRRHFGLDGHELLTPFLVDQRHDKTEIRIAHRQVFARFEKQRGHKAHFRRAAARQYRQPAAVGIDTQLATHGSLIRHQRNVIRHGVADKTARGVETVVEGFLERQEGEHHVGGGLDLVNAVLAPGPHRGADIVNRLDTGAAQFQLHPDIEIRCIHADEDIGRIGNEVAQQFATNLEDTRQTAQHLGDPHDGELFHLEQGLDAQSLHARPGDPFKLRVRVADLQLAHQTGSQNVAGDLSGDDTDTNRIRHG